MQRDVQRRSRQLRLAIPCGRTGLCPRNPCRRTIAHVRPPNRPSRTGAALAHACGMPRSLPTAGGWPRADRRIGLWDLNGNGRERRPNTDLEPIVLAPDGANCSQQPQRRGLPLAHPTRRLTIRSADPGTAGLPGRRLRVAVCGVEPHGLDLRPRSCVVELGDLTSGDDRWIETVPESAGSPRMPGGWPFMRPTDRCCMCIATGPRTRCAPDQTRPALPASTSPCHARNWRWPPADKWSSGARPPGNGRESRPGFIGSVHLGMLYHPDGRSVWLLQNYRSAGLYQADSFAPLLLLPSGTLPLALDQDGRHLA